ncbi:hypothetical protein OIO90_001203 [Microbotryomycetes sp. JL221]|nr:hypothetical protein OIO90_001203 [Microbotryomycetes sp. JL221]
MHKYSQVAQSQDEVLPTASPRSAARFTATHSGNDVGDATSSSRLRHRITSALTGRQRSWKSKLLLASLTVAVVYSLHEAASHVKRVSTWTNSISKDSVENVASQVKQAVTDAIDMPDQTFEPATTDQLDQVDEDVLPDQRESDSELKPPDVDLSAYVQERRKLRPTWPNPWHDLPKSWIGHKLLSEERFPDDEGLQDPPERDGPPPKHVAKAFEFAKWSLHQVDINMPNPRVGPHVQPSPSYDSVTGRPLPVKHKDVYLGEGEWDPPKGIKVDQIKGKNLPRVQASSDQLTNDEVLEQTRRRGWVKRAFLHAWEGYKEHAWGHDEIRPVSKGWNNGYNGWGANIVDNLDTLLIMNLSHEYNIARKHVATLDFTFLVPSGAQTFSTNLPPLEHLDVPESDSLNDNDDDAGTSGQRFRPVMRASKDQHSPTTVSWFETTIRYLGGLLAAYELSEDRLMLERAIELGDWLLPALGTKHGLPINRYMLGSNPNGLANGRVMLAEVGSMTLEFTKLSMLTGNDVYFQAAQRAIDTLDEEFEPGMTEPVDDFMAMRKRLGSLFPTYIDPSRPELMQGEYTLGGLADSYYEYLIKQAQLVSNSHPQYARMYESVAESVMNFLVSSIDVVPGREDLMNLGIQQWGKYSHTWEHLTCFAGGMLGLGSRVLNRPFDMEVAQNFTNTCAWAYESTVTGLAPETLVFFDPNEEARFKISTDGETKVPRGNPVVGVKHNNPKFIGRPETIESVFYMWRMTGDKKWQDIGWQMFTSWMEHTITDVGFASLSSVHLSKAHRLDSMESFVMAETLKYYYLLFSPHDLISLDDWVFNTEAHPLRIPKAKPTKFTSLWAGPEQDEFDTTPTPTFVSTTGEGSWVQLWARVQQAAGLLHTELASFDQDARPPPPKFRKPIKASKEDLAAARKKQTDALKKLEKELSNHDSGKTRPLGGEGDDNVAEAVPMPDDLQKDDGRQPIKKVGKLPPVALGGGRGMGGFGLAMDKPVHGH